MRLTSREGTAKMLPWRRAVRDFALFFDEVKKIPQDTRSDSIRSMVHLDYAPGTHPVGFCQAKNRVEYCAQVGVAGKTFQGGV